MTTDSARRCAVCERPIRTQREIFAVELALDEIELLADRLKRRAPKAAAEIVKRVIKLRREAGAMN